MQEIQDLVNAKVASMASDGSIEKAVNDGVEKAITSALKSQFESWGNLTKQIEEALKTGLQINLGKLDFETYNEQMLVAIKIKLGNMFAGAASEKFLSEIDELLKPVAKEVTIKDFVEKIVSFWKTDEPWDADDLDVEATVEIEVNHTHTTSHTLKMWKQKNSRSSFSSHRENSPDVQLFIIDGKIRISHKHTYNPYTFSEHEAYIFKLYGAGSVITGLDEFDIDDCDLTLKEEHN